MTVVTANSVTTPPRRARDLVTVWTVRLDSSVVWPALECLDGAEREHLGTLATEPLRRRYTRAHVALRSILGDCLDRDPGALTIHRAPCTACGGAHGKPVLADGAAHFNLSHSGELAVIAVAAQRVGVDVEDLTGAPRNLEGVAASICTAAELARLSDLPEAARRLGFLSIWTRKEAAAKLTGHGLNRPLSDIVLSADGRGATLCAAGPLSSHRVTLHAFVGRDGCLGAVATDRPAAVCVRPWRGPTPRADGRCGA